MKHLKNFSSFLGESNSPLKGAGTPWEEMVFSTMGEKEVADVTEESLLSKHLFVICEDDALYDKLDQIASSTEGEPVLETNGHNLVMFTTPIEFLRWDKLGSNGEAVEYCYVVKGEDLNKI